MNEYSEFTKMCSELDDIYAKAKETGSWDYYNGYTLAFDRILKTFGIELNVFNDKHLILKAKQ